MKYCSSVDGERFKEVIRNVGSEVMWPELKFFSQVWVGLQITLNLWPLYLVTECSNEGRLSMQCMNLKITLLSLSHARMRYTIDVIVRLDSCVPYSWRHFQFSDYDGSFPQKAKIIFVEKIRAMSVPSKVFTQCELREGEKLAFGTYVRGLEMDKCPLCPFK